MSIVEKLGIADHEMSDIIETFNNWKITNSEFDGMWYGYEQFSDCTNIDIKKLKKIIPYLKEKGIVYYTNLFDYEYKVAGSGYILDVKYQNKSWEEIKELI